MSLGQQRVVAGPAQTSTSCWLPQKEVHARLSSAFKEVVDNALSLDSEVRVALHETITVPTEDEPWRAEGPFLVVETDTYVEELAKLFDTGHQKDVTYGRHNLKGVGSKLFQAKLGPADSAAELLVITVDEVGGRAGIGRFGPQLDDLFDDAAVSRAVCGVSLDRAGAALDFGGERDRDRFIVQAGILTAHPFACGENRELTGRVLHALVDTVRASMRARGGSRCTRFIYWNLAAELRSRPAERLRVGERVSANFLAKGRWFPGRVAFVHTCGGCSESGGVSVTVEYDDKDLEAFVPPPSRVQRAQAEPEPSSSAAGGGGGCGAAVGEPRRLVCPDDLLDELAASYLPPGTGLFPLPEFGDDESARPLRASVQGQQLRLERDSLLAQLSEIARAPDMKCKLSGAECIELPGVRGRMVGCWPPLQDALMREGATRYTLHKSGIGLSGTYVCWKEKVLNAGRPHAWFTGDVLADPSRDSVSLESVITIATGRGDGTSRPVYDELCKYLGLSTEDDMASEIGLSYAEFRKWKPKPVRARRGDCARAWPRPSARAASRARADRVRAFDRRSGAAAVRAPHVRRAVLGPAARGAARPPARPRQGAPHAASARTGRRHGGRRGGRRAGCSGRVWRPVPDAARLQGAAGAGEVGHRQHAAGAALRRRVLGTAGASGRVGRCAGGGLGRAARHRFGRQATAQGAAGRAPTPCERRAAHGDPAIRPRGARARPDRRAAGAPCITAHTARRRVRPSAPLRARTHPPGDSGRAPHHRARHPQTGGPGEQVAFGQGGEEEEAHAARHEPKDSRGLRPQRTGGLHPGARPRVAPSGRCARRSGQRVAAGCGGGESDGRLGHAPPAVPRGG